MRASPGAMEEAPSTAAAAHPGGIARAKGREARAHVLREIALILTLFLIYRLARLAIAGHDAVALQNAWKVWDVERALWMPDEETLQDWFLQWPDLLKAANWFYVGVHFPATTLFLAWAWWRRWPAEYRWIRRLLTVVTGLAMIGHVAMPLAPPRMLPDLGFLDTMAVLGPSAYQGGAAGVANQFAAMPSLHVGWALVISVVLIRLYRSPLRWLSLLHPAMTVTVVVVTANHYWLDILAAALLVLVALAVTPQPFGVAPALRWWRAARGLALARPAVPPRGSVMAPTGSAVSARPIAGAEPQSAPLGPPAPRTPAE